MVFLIMVGTFLYGVASGFSGGVVFALIIMFLFIVLKSFFFDDIRGGGDTRRPLTEGISDRHIDTVRQRDNQARDYYNRNH